MTHSATQLIYENLNLLDKMHEGLIVVSKEGLELQLASAPAIGIMKRQATDDSGSNCSQSLPSRMPVVEPVKKQKEISKLIGLHDLQKKMFEPVDVSVESA